MKKDYYEILGLSNSDKRLQGEDFTKVLNEGLDTEEFNEQMGYEKIKAHLLTYLRPVKTHQQLSLGL